MNIIYYFYRSGVEQIGPFTIQELANEPIKNNTSIWKEGTDIWQEASFFPELVEQFNWNSNIDTAKNNNRNHDSVSKKDEKWGKSFVFLLLAIGIVTFCIFQSSQSGSKYTESAKIYEEEKVPPPPIIKVNLSSHKKKFFKELFKNCNLSGNKKQLVNACNYDQVRDYSVQLAGLSQGEFNLGQVCNIWEHYKKNWKYVNDPKSGDYVAFASETINNNFNGDCDDFAVVLCSSILAVGGEARINYAFGNDGGHAFTEVNIGNTDLSLVNDYIKKRYKNINTNDVQFRTDEKGNRWLNVDWFSDYLGGKYFQYTNGTSFYIIQEYCEDF